MPISVLDIAPSFDDFDDKKFYSTKRSGISQRETASISGSSDSATWMAPCGSFILEVNSSSTEFAGQAGQN